MRVLIADDQENVGSTLALLVNACRHHVVGVVRSGVEAIQAYRQSQPDIVLMDCRMAKFNGATACRYILAEYPDARIVFVSSWPLSPDFIDAGAIATLQKPVSLDELDGLLKSMDQQLDLDFGQARR